MILFRIVSNLLFGLAFVVAVAIATVIWQGLTGSEFGRGLRARHPWLYRRLTGTNDWFGDDDDEPWTGGPPAAA